MIFKDYPILYLDINQNKKRFWKIWIQKQHDLYLLFREYGILNGKITKPQPIELHDSKKIITKANSLFKKKIESGFYEFKKNNQLKTKQSIIKPMGAHKLDDHYSKLIYPVCVQKKLDGYRCLAHFNQNLNKIELFTRNMKKYHHLPHIRQELSKVLKNNNIYLDGELYEHGIKLHDIGSIVRKEYVTQNNIEEMKKISFYVFDMFDTNNMNLTFQQRYNYLKNNIFTKKFKFIKLVNCVKLNNYIDVLKENDKYILDGFEGVIVRNLNGLYEFNKKSYNVLRTKEFKKDIFTIVGAKKGQGAQKDAIIWECKCSKSNKSFWAIPIGSIPNRIKLMKEYLKNPNLFIDKKVRVKYLQIDDNGCVTRNPIVEEFINE